MQEDFLQINVNHINTAINLIKYNEANLQDSLFYSVIINGEEYPPKEIIRISLKIATGSDPGEIYSYEPVLKRLSSLGFEIVKKNSLWKLGTNWGHGSPSFYEFIKKENIVLSIEKYPYKKGDYVVITEGFKVYAITKVIENPIPITENESYLNQSEENAIPYEDWVTYAKVEWFTLPQTDVFTYKLQSGIRRVNKNEIKDRVEFIWNKRNRDLSGLSFYLKDYHSSPKANWSYPAFVIIPSSFDDFGYKTSHFLYFYRSKFDRIEIGPFKVLYKHSNRTVLPSDFQKLNDNFCSLGETLEYYERLKSELPKDYLYALRSLNDCAFFDNIRKEFEDHTGFKASLLRSSEAELALNEAKRILEGEFRDKEYQFSFRYRIGNALKDHEVDFSFNVDRNLPNRFFCLVGKNGTGKTKFLSQLANKLTNVNEDGEFHPKRPSFSKIIATSFSYFDKFKFPQKGDISYEFIGIKSERGLQTETDSSNILWKSYNELIKNKTRKDFWIQCLKNSLEINYLDFEIDSFESLIDRSEFISKTEDIFSSGQKIVFQFITRVLSQIEKNSLLIFDEPETHLHPNIAGRLIRVINQILKEYESFCILATHSPIIVQEIPSKFIRIIDRKFDFPIIHQPIIECFGENLSVISNFIFRVDEDKEIYKSTLEDLFNSKTISQIEQLFEGKLSLNARLYLQNISKKND